MDVKDFLKEPFVDSERVKAIRLALTKAYSENDRVAIEKAAQEAQEYVDEGGDFDDWQFDDSIEDYNGKDAEMLTEKYLVRLLHDRSLDCDDDQDYIRTGWHIDMSPLYKQFKELKKKYPDAVLLFRDDDEAYCAYEEDADKLSKACDCPLLNWNGVKAAGFPHNALDMMLPKLIRAGHRVAICDPLKDIAKVRKQVERTKELHRKHYPEKYRKEPVQLELFTF